MTSGKNYSHAGGGIERLESRSYFSVDLAAAVSVLAPAQREPGKNATLSVEVTNDGTTLAAGKLTIDLSLSASADGSAPPDTAAIVKPIHLKAGAHTIFHIPKKIPLGSDPGVYYAAADLDPSNLFSDTNLLNNTAVSTNTLTVLDPYVNIVGTWSGTIKITRGFDKKAVIPTVVKFTSENPTDGVVTSTGMDYHADNSVIERSGTGLLTTTGSYTSTGTDVPVDATGVYFNKGKFSKGIWKGTFHNAINSGTFELAYDITR